MLLKECKLANFSKFENNILYIVELQLKKIEITEKMKDQGVKSSTVHILEGNFV